MRGFANRFAIDCCAGTFLAVIWALVNIGLHSTLAAQDRTCVMPGQEVQLVFGGLAVNGLEADGGALKEKTAQWILSKSGRTLARGRAKIQRKPDEGQERSEGQDSKTQDRDRFQVKFQLEDLRLQSIVETDLKLVVDQQEFSKTICLFPKNPFEGKENDLKEANLFVYDPVGDSVKEFKELGLPFKLLRRMESINSVDAGLVIIGEGLEKPKCKRIAEHLTGALERGVNVIWLAPESESVEFENRLLKQLEHLESSQSSIVNRFDHRFVTEYWNGMTPVAKRWAVQQTDESISLVESDSGPAWSWIEMGFRNSHPSGDSEDADGDEELKSFPRSEPRNGAVKKHELRKSRSTLVICGLGLIKHWKDGPVARHLLWRIIESKIEQQKTD